MAVLIPISSPRVLIPSTSRESSAKTVAIRARAIDRGLLDASVAADEDELHRIIMLPGFSTREQVIRVANAFFRGEQGLILLEVDPARLHQEAAILLDQLESLGGLIARYNRHADRLNTEAADVLVYQRLP